MSNNLCNEWKLLDDVLKMMTSKDSLVQIKIVKQVAHEMSRNHDIDFEVKKQILDNFCEIYFQTTNKDPLKKKLASVLQDFSSVYHEYILGCLVKNVMHRKPSKITDLKDVDNFFGLLDNFPVGSEAVQFAFVKVMEYLSDALELLHHQLNQDNNLVELTGLFDMFQNVVKTLSSVLQTCGKQLYECLQRFQQSDGLYESVCSISKVIAMLLENDLTSLNCKVNAGIAFSLIIKAFVGEEIGKVLFMNKSTKCSEKTNLPVFLQLDIFSMCPSSQLYVWAGLLSTFSMDVLTSVDLNGCCLLTDIILPEILQLIYGDDLVLASSRVLQKWTRKTREALHQDKYTTILKKHLDCKGKVIQSLLHYVWTHWEHYIDGVRHATKEIFKDVLMLHSLVTKKESTSNEFLRDVTVSALKMPAHRQGKYGTLSCVVEQIGCKKILHFCPSLSEDLFEALTEANLACHYVLPKLLKADPYSVSYIIELMPPEPDSSTGCYLTFLMKCAKYTYNSGVTGVPCSASAQSGSNKWRDILPMHVMKEALVHADDQIRIDAFWLLCEAKKLPVHLNSIDLELVKLFIPLNMDSQSPAFRQQLQSHIKKLLIKIRELGNILRKKEKEKEKNLDGDGGHTQLVDCQTFMEWLWNFMFDSLHPSANFPRRCTALRIVSLITSVFQNVHDDACIFSIKNMLSSFQAQTLMECLQDSYEANKQIALELLNKLPSSFLGFHDKCKVEEVLQQSLSLAKSSKPPDPVSAGYLLALLVNHPLTKAVAEELERTVSPVFPLLPTIMCTNKRSVCFSVLRLLIAKLQEEIKVAYSSLLTAAASGPMYGLLICIRYILNEAELRFIKNEEVKMWKDLVCAVILLCQRATQAVVPVLCSSSPEGHLPMDTESVCELKSTVQRALGHKLQITTTDEEDCDLKVDSVKIRAVTSQLLLLCSWRTHKEVSLLFGDICQNVTIITEKEDTEIGLITYEQIIEIGIFFTEQLSEVKHRGAFEQAYVGFWKLCHRLWRMPVSILQKLPEKWLQELLSVIRGESSNLQLCSTRRSAGVPFLVQALLVTEPEATRYTFFKHAMSVLIQMAMTSSLEHSESQVHAMNILRALYRDTHLGENVISFAGDGVQCALLGFKGKLWAVRNAATLLFSALMTRIFGVNRSREDPHKKNCMTGKIFFQRFPSLFEFLLNEIKEATTLNKLLSEGRQYLHPILYPILLLLARLYPAVTEDKNPNMNLTLFVPYVMHCGYSKVWEIRVLAARALVPLVVEKYSMIKNLFVSLSAKSNSVCPTQQWIHGTLLQLQELLKDVNNLLVQQKTALQELLPSWLEESQWILEKQNLCMVTKASYLDVLFYVLRNGFLHDIDGVASYVFEAMEDFLLGTSILPGKEMYYVSIIRLGLIIFVHHEQPKELFTRFILDALNCSVYEVKLTVLHFLKWLLTNNSVNLLEFSFDVGLESCRNEDWGFCNEINRKIYLAKFVKESEEIGKKLVQEAFEPENYSCCVTEAFNVMTCLQTSWSILPVQKMQCILDKLVTEKCSDDEWNTMFIFSSILGLELYNDITLESDADKEEAVNLLHKWFIEVEGSSLPGRTVACRYAVVHVLLKIASLLKDERHILGPRVIPLWVAMVNLLQDDEPVIKYMCGTVISVIENNSGECNIRNKPVVPQLALKTAVTQFVQLLGSAFPAHCVSVLLQWCLHCDLDENGHQGDEQPFEKGEMNVYQEEITLSDLCHPVLKRFCSGHQHQLIPNILISVEHLNLQHYNITKVKAKKLTLSEICSLCIEEMKELVPSIVHDLTQCPLAKSQTRKNLILLYQKAIVVETLWGISTKHSENVEHINNIISQLELVQYPDVFVNKIQTNLRTVLH
ncbi:tRNA (32-2'-O)-methyltransferase regulator THADA-like isoform X2 [Tachypleus tridentatus]|uniref:tRNA (32-2'-O)-methyltransferase regulator THADA-like isoform X2 n=1 Tax=Tachypleus tridentatus TaxID=6853 RepID=UPI003FD221E4